MTLGNYYYRDQWEKMLFHRTHAHTGHNTSGCGLLLYTLWLVGGFLIFIHHGKKLARVSRERLNVSLLVVLYWQVGWLTSWLVSWLTRWLIGWLLG